MPGNVPSLGPTLETARLILRVPCRDDFESWAAVAADEKVMHHLGGVRPRFTTWSRFLATVGAWQIQGFNAFSVIEKVSGRWIGRVGPLYPEGWPGTEMGWTLARDAWGHGYATEAASAATQWAFDVLGWKEIIHCIAPDNVASQHVAQRLGSVKRGLGGLPPPHADESIEIWGQTREEWFARRAQ